MAYKKLGRNYKLIVQVSEDGQKIEIEPPFTIEFDIIANILTSANTSSFRIYNLAKNNRNLLRKNYLDNLNITDVRAIEFRAGYGSSLPIVFQGTVTQAWSIREDVNFVTQIECFDGGFAFANGELNVEFPANTQRLDVINGIIDNIPTIERGHIGNIDGTLSRGNSYSKNGIDVIRELTDGNAFVDKGRLNILGENEAFEGDIAVINAASGLIGSPILEQGNINLEMIFEPRIQLGQVIRLESLTADDKINGVYKVVGVKHRGTISDTVAATAVTTVSLFYSNRLDIIS